jgi:hypothetical protein
MVKYPRFDNEVIAERIDFHKQQWKQNIKITYREFICTKPCSFDIFRAKIVCIRCILAGNSDESSRDGILIKEAIDILVQFRPRARDFMCIIAILKFIRYFRPHSDRDYNLENELMLGCRIPNNLEDQTMFTPNNLLDIAISTHDIILAHVAIDVGADISTTNRFMPALYNAISRKDYFMASMIQFENVSTSLEMYKIRQFMLKHHDHC